MAAEDDMATVRSSLLLVAQTGDPRELGNALRGLDRLKAQAFANQMPSIAELCLDCENSIAVYGGGATVSPGAAYSTLDLVARIEAAVWDVPMQSDDFLSDIAGFVDSSFEKLVVEKPEVEIDLATEFEIDEETLEIFRSEADELLANISSNLHLLAAAPNDQAALWEVRRNAHTFKGAAGIVGLDSAAAIAHKMEDLLDKLVETRAEPGSAILDFLVAGASSLKAMVASRPIEDDDFENRYNAAIASIEGSQEHIAAAAHRGPDARPVAPTDPVRPATPIVRVSLDRLDEVIKISRSLNVNRAAMREVLEDRNAQTEPERIASLLEAQQTLCDELYARLLAIRMVRFGTLEARLSRNVHTTSIDENKKALLEILNPDVEIDTQVIDALIEPLLHLLKNAVVHGIESPETRRLLGKPERGMITVEVEADSEAVVIAVRDDGSGISIEKLKEKAISNGLITAQQADAMTDREAVELIFDRGLTTASKVDLNAGRGVGMSIVKESVEARGGTVVVRSEPQLGTTFTICMPLGSSSFGERVEVAPDARAEPPLVLVVDDSPSIRRQTSKLAENAGLRVITANNGADALELLLNGEWQPDLILSDVEMPQMDGWGLLEYLKTDENFGQIPVVMVTSLSSDEHRQRGADLGASEYLIKPLSEASLDRVISQFLTTA